MAKGKKGKWIDFDGSDNRTDLRAVKLLDNTTAGPMAIVKLANGSGGYCYLSVFQDYVFLHRNDPDPTLGNENAHHDYVASIDLQDAGD